MLKSYETPELYMLKLNIQDVLMESENVPEDTNSTAEDGQYGFVDGGDL